MSVYDGYGTTETAGIAVDDTVTADCTVRLEDVPDLGYLTTDKPHPRGEIVVKTPHTVSGYYKDPKATYAQTRSHSLLTWALKCRELHC